MALNKNTVNKDSRNTEVTLILRHFIGSTEPNFVLGEHEPTLAECLAFLQQRYQISSEVDPKRITDVRKLQMSLSEIIDTQIIESVCQDNLFLDILLELVDRNISPKEIIDAIIRTEPIKNFNTNISQLLHSYPEITEDQTKFLSFANTTQPNNANKADKLNYNSSTFIVSGGIAESTPLSSQLRNRQNLHGNTNLFNNSTLAPMRNLPIKDAIELIPKYNGVNIPLSAFLDGCREARSMIPPINEPDLAKLIKMRLFGEALKSAQSKVFSNIDEIAKFFNSIFGSAKTCHQLHGELANMRQKRNESVITFSNKIKAIAQELLEAAIREKRVHSGYNMQLEKDKVKFFIRGLHWVIKARMGQAESLDAATEQAIEIERDFACYDSAELNETIKSMGELQIDKVERSRINRVEAAELVSCRFCRKPGHVERDCWARQREQNSAAATCGC